MTSTTPSESLGVCLSERGRQLALEGDALYERLLQSSDIKAHPDNKGKLSWWDCAWSACSSAESLSLRCYLEGDWGGAIEWSVKLGRALDFYFFGDWMQKEPNDDGVINPDYWFKEQAFNWSILLDMDMPWVAVGRHWGLVDRILEFPRAEILEDRAGPVARAYYLGLARWWRDRRDTGGLEEAKQMRGAGSKQYHLQCDVALAITDRDEAKLRKAFPKAVQHFLKRRDHEEQFPMAATFLWNVAKKDGLRVELDPDVGKFLFEIPDAYWAEQTK